MQKKKLKMYTTKTVSIIIVAIFLLFSSLFSCSTDIDYNPSAIPRSLVIYSILKPDSSFNILVTKTQDIYDDEIGYIPDATVKIYNENGVICDSALYTEKGVYVSKSKVIANEKLTVQVEANGFESVRATDYTPGKVEIKKAEYQYSYEYDPIDDYLYGLLTIVFDDDANEKNYYELLLAEKQIDKGFVFYGRITPFMISNEFVYADSKNQNKPQSILFDDVICNGKEIVLKIKVYTQTPPYIIMRNTTETYYRYQTSLYTYLFTQPVQNNDFFTVDPIGIYTNVNNGFGIVAGYNQSEYQSVNVGENE